MKKENDKLIQHYDTILKETALLATFAGILFGFFLQISINTRKYFTSFDKELGLIHSGITLYLGIEIALGSVLNTVTAFALAAIPFIIVYIYFRERR